MDQLSSLYTFCMSQSQMDRFGQMYYGTFAESARKNVTGCGPEAKGYRSFDTQREEKYQIKDS